MDSVPTFYLIIHKDLKKHSKGKFIERKVALSLVRKLHNIPKCFSPVIIKELETFGLVKFEERDLLSICNPQASDVIENTSLLYNKVGLW